MNAITLIQKAYEAILANDFERAAGLFERAIAVEPGQASHHYKLSITCARSGRLVKAETHAASAAALEPDNAVYRLHLQHVAALVRTEQARRLYDLGGDRLYLTVGLLKEAIALDPLLENAYLLLGMSYTELGDYLNAVQAYRELLKLDPQHRTASLLLKQTRVKLADYLRYDDHKQ